MEQDAKKLGLDLLIIFNTQVHQLDSLKCDELERFYCTINNVCYSDRRKSATSSDPQYA